MKAKPATAEEYVATFPAEVQNTLRVRATASTPNPAAKKRGPR